MTTATILFVNDLGQQIGPSTKFACKIDGNTLKNTETVDIDAQSIKGATHWKILGPILYSGELTVRYDLQRSYIHTLRFAVGDLIAETN